MSNFYSEVERILKNTKEERLGVALFYYGQDVEVYKAQDDKYSKVYGSMGGESHSYYKTIKGIISNDVEFAPFDGIFSGNFQEGAFYTNQMDDVKVGDVIKVVSQDGRSRRFKIDNKESIGQTTEVFPRYVIVALAD